MKEKNISLRTKIIIPVIVVNAIICMLLGVVVYKRTDLGYRREGGKEALSIVNIVSSMIDADALSAYIEDETNTEAYENLFSTMSDVQSQTNAPYVYVLSEIQGDVYYIVTADPADTEYSLADSTAEEGYRQAMQGSEYCSYELDISEYGKLITAYAPIYKDQEIIGVLAVDYNGDEIVELIREMNETIAFLTICSIIVASILLHIIIKRELRGLIGVSQFVKEIVGEETIDLRNEYQYSSKDEVGVLVKQFNHLIERTHHSMELVQESSNQLGTSVEQVAKMSADSYNEIESISSTMQEMSAVMEESHAGTQQIVNTIGTITEDVETIYSEVAMGQQMAHDIAKKAKEMSQNAMSEHDYVNDMTLAVEKTVANKIEKSKSVEKINELTEQILNISDQTRLLSLNAAIEAARAGEAGRGFSVVADQISSLSNECTNTAKEIQIISESVIEAVNELAKESGEAIQYLASKTKEGFSSILEIGEKYENDATRFYQMLVKFEENTGNLEHGMKAIYKSVSEMNQAVEESTSGIGQVAEASTRLLHFMQESDEQSQNNKVTVQTLEEEVNRFHI